MMDYTHRLDEHLKRWEDAEKKMTMTWLDDIEKDAQSLCDFLDRSCLQWGDIKNVYEEHLRMARVIRAFQSRIILWQALGRLKEGDLDGLPDDAKELLK